MTKPSQNQSSNNSTNVQSDPGEAARAARCVPTPAADLPVVAVVGDGQLARMMAPAASELGQSLRVLAGKPDSSAAQVTSDVFVGDYRNLDDLRSVAHGVDVITFDHEHVPLEHLRTLQAEGVNIQPGPDALENAQDKLVMRRNLEKLGVPVPAFAPITDAKTARAFWDEHDGKVCLKACRGGYDGKGVWFPESVEHLEALVDELLDEAVELLAETKVDFVGELSAMVARTPSGQVQTWPVVESVQSGGVCAEAVAPAPGISETLRRQAEQLAVTVAEKLDVTGVLAVELFYYRDASGAEQLSVNELAMRPHNTGHWSQDGCVTSQFEQHLRAVMDYPLGATEPTAAVTVMANVLGGESDPEMPMRERVRAVWQRFPQAKVHLYGKDYRPGRKMGHVNISGAVASPGDAADATPGEAADVAEVRRQAHLAANFVVNARWDDGYTG